MSRLIVKNLPAYLTQERLRKHFESSDGPGGTLTDVKLMLKPDGTSRRFGFIGYKSPQEAERAKKWFNRSFVDSSRITVDVIDVGSVECSHVFPHTNTPDALGCEGCSHPTSQQASEVRSISRGGRGDIPCS